MAELEALIRTQPKSMIVALIAPDQAAGENFENTLRINNIDTVLFQRETPARVVGDQMTANPQAVSAALSKHLLETIEGGHRIASITCNTESAKHFVEEAKRLVHEKGYIHGKDYFLITTLDALKEVYPDRSMRPLFLGTTPLCRELPKEDFDTFANTGKMKLQDAVQQIIWRVKAITKSDVRTAPMYAKKLDDPQEFDQQLCALYKALKNEKIDRVIMGCTELPIAFARMKELIPDFKLETVDPAHAVAVVVKKELERMK